MTIKALQTKLNSALVQNDAGDYALRSVMDGGQDLNGEYLLNDQTTTNMMSKGTVYRFDGVDDLVAITVPAVGLSDWFYKVTFSTTESGTAFILGCEGDTATTSWDLYVSGGTTITSRMSGSAGLVSATASVFDGKPHTVIGTFDRDGNALLYVDGILAATADISGGVANDVSDTALTIGKRATGDFWEGSISEFICGNFAPTASEVKDLISGNIPFHYQGATQVAQTSGTLTIGKTYIIDDWITADDFTNVGGLNVDGTIFVATGTTPTTWTNSSSLRPLGAVALYDQTSITANNWFDLANGNTGAVTGASVLNPDGLSTDEDNIPNFSVTSGITADTGSAQGNGVLTASINQIATCANAGDAVTLPSAKPGKVLWVFNDGANASDVFPASGDNIDEAGANTALSVAVDAEVQFICTSAGHWSTITSA
jgi:hypothetical protein